MWPEFEFFNFFNEVERVFADIGAFGNVRAQDIIEVGSEVFLRGSYVGGYEARGVIF